ncbi:hypothetical protein [Enterococcus phage vB_EhiS_268]|uniref:Uncharacterized protein n=1 Tax=Enterococcus phage vB_EhiS_268 TaxID=2736817 RepID=A0ACA9AT84_9CAUD|nr:hypothetical protein [Enterococcus phage vB_EhiS_268]
MKVEFTGTLQEIKEEMQGWLGMLDEPNQEKAIIEILDITGDPGDIVLVNNLKTHCKRYGADYTLVEKFLRENGSTFRGRDSRNLNAWFGAKIKEE